MKKKFLILLILPAVLMATMHKYYHSHCSMELKSATSSAEVVLELFFHDVETCLSKKMKKQIKIEDPSINTYLQDYLKENFILKDKTNAVLNFEYVGSEVKKDQLLIYLEYKNISSFKDYTLTNRLLTEVFPSQINKVNLKDGEWKKSLVYTAKNTSQKLPSKN